MRISTFQRLPAKLFYLAVCSILSLHLYGQSAQPYEIKSAFLLNFIEYFIWENESRFDVYKIGIIDDEDVFQVLKAEEQSRLIKNKGIIIERINDISKMSNYHLLFVGSSSTINLQEIAIATRSSNTLIVTDNETAKNYFMLNLVTNPNNTISFEVNKPNIVFEGLQMDNQILLLGGTELDVAELFNSLEIETSRIQLLLNQRLNEIGRLQEVISVNQEESNSQLATIENQSELMAQQLELIEASRLQLSQIEEQFEIANIELNISQTQFLDRSRELEDKNVQLITQALLIEENNNLLNGQTVDIDAQNALLSQQRSEVLEQNITIDNYRLLIQGTALSLFLFLILLGIILWINLKRKQVNSLLAEQNIELEQTQYELQQESNRANQANQAKSRFLTNLSHEIRSPMNAILGYSELLQLDDNANDHQRNSLEAIHRNGNHLLTLINDVLDMSKIDAGKVQVYLSNFDLFKLVDDIDIMFHEKIHSLGLEFVINIEKNTPRHINSDQAKIKQILVNLLTNASKFTEYGTIKLNISADDYLVNKHNASGGQPFNLLFEVSDTGCGIATSDLDSIFSAFEQASKAETKIKGTGLGLSISQHYAMLLGGKINATSEPNAGSTFICSIQVIGVSKSEVTDIDAEISQPVIGFKGELDKYKILIVDDKKENRELLEYILGPIGFLLVQAKNGLQAVNIFQQWSPDLVLMDLGMPVMDGLEATDKILHSPSGHDCKIIAVTANVFEEQRQEIIDLGAHGFVRKPFKKEDILAAVRDALNLEYIYESKKILTESNNYTEKKTELSKNVISDENKLKVLNAIITLDTKLIHSVINDIEKEDKSLARKLASLADNYEFEKIETIIKEIS